MKVKKLEWEKTSFYEHTAIFPEINLTFKIYYNTKFNEYIPKILTVGHTTESSLIATTRNLEQAQEACQDHYEAFILSQIDPDVKPFDPTLLGFEEIEPDHSNDDYWNYKIENLYIREFIYKYKRKKIKSLMKLYKGTIKNKVMWRLYRNHEKTELFWQVPKFDPIEIPSHDFGVQLISQFLGDKV